MTNYQLRPEESFEKGKLHHRINQLEIRWPAFRGLLNLIRRIR